MRPLLVGEANPYGADPYYALYPLPERATGHRLCTLIMGLSSGEYLRRFERANLCPQRWSAKIARTRAEELLEERRGGAIVLLGRRVAAAFGCGDFPPFSRRVLDSRDPATTLYLIPHPSGLNRVWNAPDALAEARRVLAPLLRPLCKCGHDPCRPEMHAGWIP